MLSKKMAVSLTSLIITFAFVVSSAVAQDFDTTISFADVDVMYADGAQIERPSSGGFDGKLTFGHAVSLTAAQKGDSAANPVVGSSLVTVQLLNKFGGIIEDPVAAITPVTNNFDGKSYTLTIVNTDGAAAANLALEAIPATVEKVRIFIAEGAVDNANPGESKKNKKADVTVTLVAAEPSHARTVEGSKVLKIARAGEPVATVTSATFDIHVLLSEEPMGGFTTDLVDVGDNATVSSVLKLQAPELAPNNANTSLDLNGDGDMADQMDLNGDGDNTDLGEHEGEVRASGRDLMLHLYRVTIATKTGEKTVTVKIKDFDTMDKQAAGSAKDAYLRPADSVLVESRTKLTVKTNRAATPTPLDPGHVVNLTNKRVIPQDGYLIVATDPALTGINLPDAHDADDNTPKVDKRTPAELKYNVIKVGLPDLEAFLINGGTIDLVAPDAGVSISEIMWGTDASLVTNSHSQWIEIKNTSGKPLKTGDKTYKLIFYGPNETLPDRSVAANNIQDRVGTVDDNGVYWNVASKGQGGRSGHGETKTDLTAVVPTQALISMYRMPATAATGNTEAAWMQSRTPVVNIDGANRVGSPGDEPHKGFTPPAPEPKTPTPPVVIPVAAAGEIDITEIMVDTASGRFPQWIELSSSAIGEVSLDGWEMVIDNAIDDKVLGGGNAITVSLGGVTLDVSAHEGNTGKGQSVLVTAWAAQRHSDNIQADRVINLATQLNQTRRYQLLSYKGFRITLVPPDQGAIAAFGDIAGNLDEDWELLMDGRSSLIRREMDAAGMATMGTEANGWVLASSTSLITGQQSYYGDDEDSGTPGHDAGGPLPVELSHFRPARDKQTGAVVITWSTQSELNNAGFFIKRSQQRDGEFKVINAAMIAGAGTTSEKQMYTYTDTTAQPNVVYYYQIEDVSLDGQRQLLTHGTRLKGHVGAAGKATTLWGELKTSHE